MERILTSIENAIMVTATLVAFAVASLQVILRYVFNTGFVWFETTVVSLTILAAFMGGSRAVARDMHVRVTYFVSLLPKSAERITETIAAVLSLLYCLFVLYVATLYLQFLFDVGIVNIETGLPSWITGAILPVGMLFFVLRYLMILPAIVSGRSRPREAVLD